MMRQAFPRACAGALRLSKRTAPRAQATWHAAAATAARQYSVKPQAASSSKPVGLDASKLTVEKTTSPGALEKPEDLVFGRKFTGTPLLPPQPALVVRHN